MRTISRQFLFAMLCFAIIGNTACTSIRTIDATEPALEKHAIKPGDQVTLSYTDQSHAQITVTDVGESTVTGTDNDGEEVVAHFDELAAITFESFDGKETAKTTGKAIGVVVIGAIWLGAMAAGALAEGMSY